MRFTTIYTLLLTLVCTLCSCWNQQPNGQTSPATVFWLTFLQEVGDDVLENEGTAYVKSKAPDLLKLLDANPKDGKLQFAEVESFARAVQDPQRSAVLVAMAAKLALARGRETRE